MHLKKSFSIPALDLVSWVLDFPVKIVFGGAGGGGDDADESHSGS